MQRSALLLMAMSTILVLGSPPLAAEEAQRGRARGRGSGQVTAAPVIQVTGTQPRCPPRVLERYEEIHRVATHLASQDQRAATIPPGSKQRAARGAAEHRHCGAPGSGSALGVASTKQGDDRDQRPGQHHVADASRRRRAQHGDREQRAPHGAADYRHRGRSGSGQGHGHSTGYRPRDHHRQRPNDGAHADSPAHRRDYQCCVRPPRRPAWSASGEDSAAAGHRPCADRRVTSTWSGAPSAARRHRSSPRPATAAADARGSGSRYGSNHRYGYGSVGYRSVGGQRRSTTPRVSLRHRHVHYPGYVQPRLYGSFFYLPGYSFSLGVGFGFGHGYGYGYGHYPYGYSGYAYPSYGAYSPYGYLGYTHSPSLADPYTGFLRLKVRPRDAQVYVDGYYVGIVDDFDGVFQRVRLEEGPHQIEIRHPAYLPLELEVLIVTGEKGDLRG